MNSSPSFSSDDPVLQWLLSVARRADATTRVAVASRELARKVWLRAECEVFELVELVERNGPKRLTAAEIGRQLV